MTGRGNADDDEQRDSSEVPWHNRPPELIGASLLAVLVIVLVVFAVSFMTRQFSEPEEAPLNFVDPTYSVSETGSATTTTTQTITSTSPPLTTEINTPDLPSTTTSSSETSESDTAEETTAEETTSEEEETTERTTRRGPRTNVTRTLYPPP
ncbi:hypothetical protein [Mycobacterium deserti]|uniref:hypothetical protein n=1 Tax=Mycobacterium deserti TaxID=2978347 RepID=UPI0028D1B982|nr:hypothetical protein [Mycobacterium deserti]